MNQILATHNNSNNKKPINTHKIIAFFCIAIIIFGIIVASVAGYNLYKSISEKKSAQKITNPEIYIEQMDENVKISAKYENGINSIKYTWNEEDSYEINLNGTTTIERLIDLIENEGENTLKVEVIGLDGRKNEIIKTINVDNIPDVEVDQNKPIIQWVIKYNENKITAIATDESELKYIKYQWDDDEATIIEQSVENPNTLQADIEIERGQHKLVITAEDKEGNISTKSGSFKGVKKPEITATKYDNIVEITVSHDMGLKKVEFIINDKIYVYDESYIGYNKLSTSLLYKADLKEGENIIQVTAESLEEVSADTNEGTVTVYKGKCEYSPSLDTNE